MITLMNHIGVCLFIIPVAFFITFATIDFKLEDFQYFLDDAFIASFIGIGIFEFFYWIYIIFFYVGREQ